MQPIKYLISFLEKHASDHRYLFVLKDLKQLFPDMQESAFKTLMSRAVSSGYLERICRGLYAYKPAKFGKGRLLFHAAAYLRSSDFNYISLETALSDMGVISQIPINYISIMSSGRSNKISCGRFGTIDFVHTDRKAEELVGHVVYDTDYRLWRAKVSLALEDMKKTRRNCDLIDWDVANEFI
jgi:predicted transcriptional regulator of viral defense system